jgi:asparagine synthase (glutamine-hydrolysing)
VPFFCAGTDREEANEYEYARMMADRTGSELFSVSVSSGCFAEDWDFLVGEKGLPLSTPNEISIYGLSAALREKCTVTLTGEGADEIFGGYSQPHFSAYDFDRCARTPETADTDSAFGMAMLMMYGRSFFINDTDHYTATCCWMPYAIKERLFKDNVWDSLEQDNALFLFYEDFFNSLSKCSSLDKRLHLHAEFNLENLLNRIDNSSMSASVEARVPFNDHRIVEFAFRMPDEYKIDWTSAQAAQKGAELPAAEIDRLGLIETKKLPRRAFSAFLPDEIIKRRKMSFPVPFRDWFSGPLAGEIKELCLDSDFSRDFFDKKTVSAMLEKHDRNLWLTANLCKWWDVLNSVIV